MSSGGTGRNAKEHIDALDQTGFVWDTRPCSMSTSEGPLDENCLPPTDVSPGQSAARDRVRDQIEWYDRKSQHNQRWFKRRRVCQTVPAAATPAAASLSAPIGLIGGAGALIVVLEGLQQLQ